MAAMRVFSLSLLICAVLFSGGVRVSAIDLDTHCSKPEEFPLNFDLFMELLSNHTSISRELKRAPIFGDMNPDTPAYEITGHGFHFTDSYMSKDIKRALCSNNEVTFYASMYLIKAHSSGTLLEISSGTGARLTVFGVYFSAGANEILFTYRHLGIPHTVSIDQRLHPGRWRHYAFVLSGHLLQFYYDCELVFSKIVALPDFCVDEESFVVSFADDSDGGDIALCNGIHAFFQNVGFYIGRGGISKQCPGLGDECPSCGQYLKLVENTYALQRENEALKAENNRLLAEIKRVREEAPLLVTEGNTPTRCSLGTDDHFISDGEFAVTDHFGICFCRDGELECNSHIICEDNSTVPEESTVEPIENCDPPCSANEVCNNGECECARGYALVNGICENQMCREVNGEVDLAVGEVGYFFQDNPGDANDLCHIFTCQLFVGIGPATTSVFEPCSEMRSSIGRSQCSFETLTTDRDVNISICCQICTPCDFHQCPKNSECEAVNDVADCVCNNFFERNDYGDCVDINECERDENICGDFSICINEEVNHTRGFRCVCEEGYELSLLRECQDINECSALPNPCPPNSTCINTRGSYTCPCNEGYILTSDDKCAPVCSDPCQNGGTCVSPDTCACLPGYEGFLCENDVNECATPNNMCTHNFSECVNTIGGHFCRCKPGYKGNGTFCEDIDECESDIHECIRRDPENCINTEGSYVCICDNNVDCTGYCRRRGVEYPNGQSFIDSTNECKNCTCVNGEIFCHRRNCDGDCSERIVDKCCPKCASRDCYLELDDRNETIVLRRDSFWVDPKDPCIRWRCDHKLVLTVEDLSSECPDLECEDDFRVSHPGRCCKNCLLPPCDEDKEGVTLPLNNGCKQCVCQNSTWNCSDVISCPETDCEHEEIVFYSNHCCPICRSDVFGSTCQTFTRN